NVPGAITDGIVVLLGPAFLQTHDVWRRLSVSNLVADLSQSLVTVFGEELEPPAVQ
ncbi:hypothetical protein LTR28_011729, partial [Elasticomyces elasticus]